MGFKLHQLKPVITFDATIKVIKNMVALLFIKIFAKMQKDFCKHIYMHVSKNISAFFMNSNATMFFSDFDCLLVNETTLILVRVSCGGNIAPSNDFWTIFKTYLADG